jgi:glutamine synthetase
MTPKEFLDFAKKHGPETVDLKFVDLPGTWQHCSYPVDFWDEDNLHSITIIRNSDLID